jgi:hypothetical protein
MCIVKVCTCCKVAYTAEGWAALHLNGRQDDGVDVFEVRTCPCGGTSMLLIGPSPEAEAP